MPLAAGSGPLMLSAPALRANPVPFPLFAPTRFVGAPCATADRVPLASVDHAPLGALLAKYVDANGRVDYAAWKANTGDVGALHAYLAAAGRADVDGPAPRAAALAFWVNVYNALTLAGVLDLYPLASIRDRTNRVVGFNVWKNLRLHVGGRTRSLFEIEHDVLRPLADPRVHFALVCGSNGCPALPRDAYTPDAVNEQLDGSARRFLARPDAVRIDPERREVALSKLFKWYGDDFGPTPADWLTLLRRFLPPELDVDRLDADAATVRFMPYDWSLNDRASG